MSGKRSLLLVALLFLLTLIVKMPARWALDLLPIEAQCLDAGGTLWSGYCGQLRTGTVTLNDLRWQLHAAALLRGRLSLSLLSDDPNAPARGHIELRLGDTIDVTDLQATLPSTMTAGLFPGGWSGSVVLNIAQAQLHRYRLVDVVGTATVLRLESSNPRLALGGFELRFPQQARSDGPTAGDTLQATLRDLGGPLAVSGELKLTPAGAYELNGTTAPRAGADEALLRLLELLGPPDNQGRHMFSVAGTF